jgi:hypothetical protein
MRVSSIGLSVCILSNATSIGCVSMVESIAKTLGLNDEKNNAVIIVATTHLE